MIDGSMHSRLLQTNLSAKTARLGTSCYGRPCLADRVPPTLASMRSFSKVSPSVIQKVVIAFVRAANELGVYVAIATQMSDTSEGDWAGVMECVD